MEDNKRILIGGPTSNHKAYCLLEFVEAIQNISYRPLDMFMVDNSKGNEYFGKLTELGIPSIKADYHDSALKRIVDSRNILRKKVLEDERYEWLLMLEQDVIPPHDIVERLLEHKKSVVSALYYSKDPMVGNALIPMAFKPGKDGLPNMRVIKDLELSAGPRLQQIVSGGLGCVLIHRSVLEKVEFRVQGNKCFDDRWFYYDLLQNDIPAFIDIKARCKHLINNKTFKWGFELEE